MTIAQRIRELGFELPPVARPAGSYVPAVRTGNLIFTAGQLPSKAGKLIAEGKVPAEVSLETARQCAAQALLNALAAIAGILVDETGPVHNEVPKPEDELDRIARILRLNVFVNSSPGFTEQAKVANGASDLLVAIFGEAGKHTRCAIGAAELPLNAPVELDLVVEVQK